MNEANIVILAGGISSRMKNSLSEDVQLPVSVLDDAREKPKGMIRLGNNERPFLDYLLTRIDQAGYSNVVIVIGERDTSFRTYYEERGGAGQFPHLHISYAIQYIPKERTKPLGTADALLSALYTHPEWKGKSFTVCNSDNLYSKEVLHLLLTDKHPNAVIDYDRRALLFGESRISQFAIIQKDISGYLLDLIEKPTAEEIQRVSGQNGRVGVSMNIFRLSYDIILPILEELPLHPIRGEKELPVAVKNLAIRFPQSVWTIERSEHVLDLTSLADIPSVKQYLMNEFPDY